MSTEALRDLSNVLLWVGLITAACGTAGVNLFRSRLEKEREITSKASAKEAEQRATALQTKVDDLLQRNESIALQNEKLLSDIQKYQQQVEDRERRIRELEEAAKKAQRGIFERYDYNGGKRTQSGGSVTNSIGEEYSVFVKLTELEQSKNYREIVRVAERQIALTPDWLTPYLYLGVAYANLNYREKAISNLRYVVDHSGGDPEYKQAEDLLNRLQAVK
jgi:hypothetical protein